MTARDAIFRTLRAFGAAAAIGALSGGAFADHEAENHLRHNKAWEDLVVDQEGILSNAQFAWLNNLAFQAAVTRICEGYELDQAKFAEGLDGATATGPENMSEEDARHWEAAVLFRLGASYGLFLVDGNDAPDAFCASAAELKADPEVPNYWQ